MKYLALPLALLLAAACRRDAEPPPAAAQARADIPRLARDTLLARPRGVVWSAALHAAADAGYRLAWFDARAGAAEFARDSGLWMRLSVPRAKDAKDSARTRVAVLASRTPTFAPATAGGRMTGALPDDSATARAQALVASIALLASRSPADDLFADSAFVPVGIDTVEACRGTVIGEWWVEIDHRRDARRCATSRLFGIEQNVAVMQRIAVLPLFSLVYACTERARIPRGFSVGYSMMDPTRCRGAGADTANVLVLRKLF